MVRADIRITRSRVPLPLCYERTFVRVAAEDTFLPYQNFIGLQVK